MPAATTAEPRPKTRMLQAAECALVFNEHAYRDHVGWRPNFCGGLEAVDMTHGGPFVPLDEAVEVAAELRARVTSAPVPLGSRWRSRLDGKPSFVFAVSPARVHVAGEDGKSTFDSDHGTFHANYEPAPDGPKPCHKCKSAEQIRLLATDLEPSVLCYGCGERGPRCDTEGEAVETWNKQQGGGATAVEEAPVTIDNVHDDRIRLIGHPMGGGDIPSSRGEVKDGPSTIPGVPTAPEAPQSNAKFAGGAVRSKDADGVRYDLVSPIGLRRLAETYAEGAAKYGAGNWLKGFPVSDVLNHLQRHIELWKSGDRTEDHFAHAAWGLFTAMHFEETRPDLLDVSFEAKKETA